MLCDALQITIFEKNLHKDNLYFIQTLDGFFVCLKL